MERKPYLINQALKSYFAATILTMAVAQINSVVDGILMGQFIGPDALSAITLSTPVLTCVTSFYILLAGGAAMLAGKKIGERDFQRASGIFSVSMVSLAVVGLILTTLWLLFRHEIVSLFCTDKRLLDYVMEYTTVTLVFMVVTLLCQGMGQFVDVDGKPDVVAKSMTLCVVTNIFFDVVLVGVFKVGIMGSALASALGYVVSILCLFPYTFGKKSSYRLSLAIPDKFNILKQNVKNGFAMMLVTISGTITAFIVNSMILSSLGADGMFIVSIASALTTIGALLASGASQAFVNVGSMLYGQKDYYGMRMLFSRCFVIVVAAAILITVIGLVKPDLFARLFGADTPALIQSAQSSVRIIILMIIPLLIISMMPSIYQVLGHLPLVGVVSLSYYIIIMPVMWYFTKTDDPSNIWYSYPIAGWSSLIITVTLVTLYQISHKGTQFMTLIPTVDAYPHLLEMSIPCTAADTEKAAAEVNAYAETLCMPADVAVSVREVLAGIVNNSGMSAKHLIDLRIASDDKLIELMVKDNGKKSKQTTSSAAKKEYKYMYRQNMQFLTWSITQGENPVHEN